MGFLFSKSESVYISRNAWDAKNPIATFPFKFPIQSIFVTAVSSHNSFPIYQKEDVLRFLRELQKYQMFNEGLPDIAYNFYVGADERLYEGKGWGSQPTLTEKETPDHIETLAIAYVRPLPGTLGIMFIIVFTMPIIINIKKKLYGAPPSYKMTLKVKHLIEQGIEKRWIHPNFHLRGMTSGLIE